MTSTGSVSTGTSIFIIASDYFDQLYEWAVALIKTGKAYVCDLSSEEVSQYRGAAGTSRVRTLSVPRPERRGEPRPIRSHAQGRVSRRSPHVWCEDRHGHANIHLRDPLLYRIVHADTTPRTGDAWCIYPTYDFAHFQSKMIEGITHSLCTLEFEDHRPLYDWLIENLPVPSQPHQYEFARLNLTHTVLSKRFLLRLVTEGFVRGWDDPRMPTLSGLRRRGYPSEAIREFATTIGVAKSDSVIEIGQLEHAVRDVLNRTAPRRFAVLDPGGW